ncbi:tRNA (adenine(22)-N(1))-methyltransferase TrmK [Reinekea marinisedimentorum]|uniref:tRNA A22 N-methylase n=1 Tax=Reinekea marinisedimentorum TaxID=230495 RepID=A0A4R3IBP7_9GAMM|nr:tRNA (adenine(22)-N(1))-methyltransferase TrmK [Reinekea marinisedimentorum]TCS43063.1 tRNA A22 N-methylase [Reinekea marinisedimentorum]
MTNTQLKTRLGKRLRALLNAIPDGTKQVWDLCCDHGAVGRAVIESRPNCEVVFNDIHQDIMARLSKKLIALGAKNYRLEVAPAQNLKLNGEQRPTIILAGVGAEQCIEILKQLFSQPAAEQAYFIISPATKTYFVRQFLCQAGVYLADEACISENRRSYEIICIQLQQKASNRPMIGTAEDLFGACWQPGNAEQLKHLKKQLKFYQSAQKPTPETDLICQGYQQLIEKKFLNSLEG